MKIALRREGRYLTANVTDMTADERAKVETLAAAFAETEEELREYAQQVMRDGRAGAGWQERWAAGGSASYRTDTHTPSCPPNCLNPEHTCEDVQVIDVQATLRGAIPQIGAGGGWPKPAIEIVGVQEARRRGLMIDWPEGEAPVGGKRVPQPSLCFHYGCLDTRFCLKRLRRYRQFHRARLTRGRK